MAYCNKKDFSNAWQDVHKAQSLGFEPPPEFMEILKKFSGREK
jgi:hypothetical protein